MILVVCSWLMGIVVIAIAFHVAHLSDLKRIAEAERNYQAALNEANALGSQQDGQGRTQTEPDMTNRSRYSGNGPRIAKYEGVSRERGNH